MRLLKYFLVFLLLLLISGVGIGYWLIQPGQKDITFLSRPILKLALKNDKYSYDISKVELDVTKERLHDKVSIKDVKIFERSQDSLVGKVRELNIVFDLQKVLHREKTEIKLNLDQLVFEVPRISSLKKEDSNEQTFDVFGLIYYSLKNNHFFFNEIALTNNTIGFAFGEATEIFRISEGKLRFDNEKNSLVGNIKYKFKNFEHSINLHSFVQDNYLKTIVEVSNIPFQVIFNQLDVKAISHMQDLRNIMSLSANFEHDYHYSTKTSTTKINVKDLSGRIFTKEQEKPFILNKFSCQVEMNSRSYGDLYDLQNLEVKFLDNNYIKLQGKFNNGPTPYFKGVVEIRDIETSLLEYFLYDKTSGFMEFVIKNELGGVIKFGKIDFDLGKALLETGDFTGSKIKGAFDLKQFRIKYDPDFPAVEDITAVATINNDNVLIKVLKARSLETKLVTGSVKMKLQDFANQEVFINAKSIGPTSNLSAYIPSEVIEKLKSKDIDLSHAKGEATGNIKIVIPIYGKDNNIYDISAKAKTDIDIFNGDVKIKDAELSGGFDGKNIIIKAPCKVNGFASNLNFKFNIKEEIGSLKLTANLTQIPESSSLIKVNSGQANLYFILNVAAGNTSYKLNADLKALDMEVEKFGYKKEKGHPAIIDIFVENAERAAGKIKILGEKVNISGTIVSNEHGGMHLNLPVFKIGRTDIKVNYERIKDNTKLTISGKVVDLSEANLAKFVEKETQKYNSQINGSIDKIHLKNGIDFENAKFYMKCDKDKCYDGLATVDLGGNKFASMEVKPVNADAEQWVIRSDDAGKLLKGLGVYQHVNGGKLRLVADVDRVYQKTRTSQISALRGKFEMRNFGMNKTPFLTRIVSFISLPGLMGAITNQKISFTTFDADFKFDDDVLTIANGDARGPFFDFGVRGKIYPAKRVAKIRGEVIPSLYGISTIVRKVPIIGKILSGGKRKGLIFAPFAFEHKY